MDDYKNGESDEVKIDMKKVHAKITTNGNKPVAMAACTLMSR